MTIEDIVYNPGTTHFLVDTKDKDEGGGTSRRLQVKKRKRTAELPKGMLFLSRVCSTVLMLRAGSD